MKNSRKSLVNKMYEEEVKQLKKILTKLQEDDIIDIHIQGDLEEFINELEAEVKE